MTTQTKKEEHLDNILADETEFLDRYVRWALWIMAIIVVIATVTAQVESYNGLYIWFATHQVPGFWADWGPLAIDGITVVGELAVFAAIARRWDLKSRLIPWFTAISGFAASVAANVGTKVHFHSIPTDLTAAVFPVVGALGIVISLGVLKRVARDRAEAKARQREATIMLSPQDVADQLLKDNQELTRKLREAETTRVVDISPPEPDRELKGMEVLIPQKPPEEQWPNGVTVTSPDVPTAALTEVSREEARRRMSSSPQYGGRVISPEGLDVRSTGAMDLSALRNLP